MFTFFKVDYTLFNNTYEVDTPLCSARQLDEIRASVNAANRGGVFLIIFFKFFYNFDENNLISLQYFSYKRSSFEASSI